MRNLILIGSILVPAIVMLTALVIQRLWRVRDKRRSPINSKILNFPGEHLRSQISRHDESFNEASTLAIAVGPIILSAWLLARTRNVDWSKLQYGWGDLIIAGTGGLLLGWSIWRAMHHSALRRRYMQALEAELAVGQSLSRAQILGALVFHDFPADKFNIDHIVIGRSVVFAVETKSRKKPPEKGKSASKIRFDGKTLEYPGGINEQKPVEQARAQAEWLANFLSSGVGEPVRVVAVLALPGWYTETTIARPDVLASNCANPDFMMGGKFGQPMPESMRTRIAHVLTERYPAFEVDALKH